MRIILRRRTSSGSLEEMHFSLERISLDHISVLSRTQELELLADMEYQANGNSATVTGRPFVRVHVEE